MSKQRRAKLQRNNEEMATRTVHDGLRFMTEMLCAQVMEGEFETCVEPFNLLSGASVLAHILTPNPCRPMTDALADEAEDLLERACIDHGWKPCERHRAGVEAEARMNGISKQ